MDLKILEDLGLSKTEVKVYLALIDLGPSLAGEITKKSTVNRTNVYDALERLIEKGIVSYVIVSNRKVFEAESPSVLYELLKERREKLDSVMKDLSSRFKASKVKEEAIIFRGKNGIKSIFEDMIKVRKEIFVYGVESRFKIMFPAYQKDWNKRRAMLSINMNMIYGEKKRREKKKEGLKLTQMKFLPKHYDFPSTVVVYGNNVANIIWTEQPFGFLLRSKDAAKSHLNFFDILWNVAKK